VIDYVGGERGMVGIGWIARKQLGALEGRSKGGREGGSKTGEWLVGRSPVGQGKENKNEGKNEMENER
jgi:hypothetical protein